MPNERLNPLPILDAALEIVGLPVVAVRLPTCEATHEEKALIETHLVRLGVI